MTTFASGKHALAISDRSGLAFPYLEMVREWNGAWVHFSEFEPKPRSYDIINLSNIKGAFFQINFILEYLSDGVFEYLEDHLEEDKLDVLQANFEERSYKKQRILIDDLILKISPRNTQV